jgi:hypothetical protein
MMHHAKEHAISVQLIGRSPLDVSLPTARDRCLAAVTCRLGVALELSGDGVGRALEHFGYLAYTVLLMNQAGQGHAFFGLELAIAFGWGVLHQLTLIGWQVLHFTFESARLNGERRVFDGCAQNPPHASGRF